jgi:hypothetical protein
MDSEEAANSVHTVRIPQKVVLMISFKVISIIHFILDHNR